MSNEEKIEELKTTGEKQKTINWLDDYFQKILEKEDKMKKMINDSSYVTWLEEFTKKYSAFGDDDWLYNPLDIPKEDMQNVQMLQLLYNIIDKYAQSNYIYPTYTEFGSYYVISYNNIGYRIDMMVGQGGVFSCQRVEVTDGTIKFQDIQNNRKLEKTDFINCKLQVLADLIETMILEEIPIEAIENTTTKSIDRVVKRRKK